MVYVFEKKIEEVILKKEIDLSPLNQIHIGLVKHFGNVERFSKFLLKLFFVTFL